MPTCRRRQRFTQLPRNSGILSGKKSFSLSCLELKFVRAVLVTPPLEPQKWTTLGTLPGERFSALNEVLPPNILQ